MFKNTMIYLIGFPGVGKYTVAQEIARQADFTLVDNHLINNPILSLLKPDGKTPLPPATWRYIERIRDIVFEALGAMAPPERNFILTNVLMDNEKDKSIFAAAMDSFERRGSTIIPVILTCEGQEHGERIVDPGRHARLKMTDAAGLARMRAEKKVMPVDHKNLLHLDTTALTPEQTAASILVHAAQRAS